MKELPDWKLNKAETTLTASFANPDYISGLVMIARIAVHAEILNHHPDIKFTYHKLTVSLTTHEVRGISVKDIQLASRISNLFKKQ